MNSKKINLKSIKALIKDLEPVGRLAVTGDVNTLGTILKYCAELGYATYNHHSYVERLDGLLIVNGHDVDDTSDRDVKSIESGTLHDGHLKRYWNVDSVFVVSKAPKLILKKHV
jgi:hypothetical protein